MKRLFLMLLILGAIPYMASAAEVKNLKVGQIGDNAVATYDLVGRAGEQDAELTVVITIGNERRTSDQLSLTGDFGKGVKVGTGKKIVWNVLKDFPTGTGDNDLSWAVKAVNAAGSASSTLVDMHDGTIYDTDTQLSWLKDAGAGGEKNWEDANAWVASLNSGNGFAGLDGWRLPNTDPSCGTYFNCINSEMGHLYYLSLGNRDNSALTNTGPFTNLRPSVYWSGTEYAPNPSNVWFFDFNSGNQDANNKGNHNYALAVRPGAR